MNLINMISRISSVYTDIIKANLLAIKKNHQIQAWVVLLDGHGILFALSNHARVCIVKSCSCFSYG